MNRNRRAMRGHPVTNPHAGAGVRRGNESTVATGPMVARLRRLGASQAVLDAAQAAWIRYTPEEQKQARKWLADSSDEEIQRDLAETEAEISAAGSQAIDRAVGVEGAGYGHFATDPDAVLIETPNGQRIMGDGRFVEERTREGLGGETVSEFVNVTPADPPDVRPATRKPLDVPTGPSAELLAWVGGDHERARAALIAEANRQGGPRADAQAELVRVLSPKGD